MSTETLRPNRKFPVFWYNWMYSAAESTDINLLVTGTRKFDHITPVLRELHWLPVRQWVKFKTAVLVFKCLHGLAPAYLADYCQPTTVTTGRTRLRSANTQQLAIPRTNTDYGDRSFAVSGPSVWNSLPTALRMSDCSLTTFRTAEDIVVYMIHCI